MPASAGTPGVVIETSRLRMRSLRDGDLADPVTLAGNWEVARWLATMPYPYTEADVREWIGRVQQDHATGRPRRFAVALRETDRLIGGVGLDGSPCDETDEPALGRCGCVPREIAAPTRRSSQGLAPSATVLSIKRGKRRC